MFENFSSRHSPFPVEVGPSWRPACCQTMMCPHWLSWTAGPDSLLDGVCSSKTLYTVLSTRPFDSVPWSVLWPSLWPFSWPGLWPIPWPGLWPSSWPGLWSNPWPILWPNPWPVLCPVLWPGAGWNLWRYCENPPCVEMC